MNPGVVPADKNLRKKFIIFLGLTITAIFLFAPYFNDYIDQIKQISKENPEVAFEKTILILKIVRDSFSHSIGNRSLFDWPSKKNFKIRPIPSTRYESDQGYDTPYRN